MSSRHEQGGGRSGTELRILKAAMSLTRARGIARVTMADVADAAGVSRQAVYLHFGSRARLLLEMVRYHDEAARITERMTAAMRDCAARDAIATYVRAWCEYLPELMPFASALSSAPASDKAAQAAWRDRMGFLRERAGARVIRRLAEEGLLAPGWTVEQATDWLWSQLHPDNWRHLVEEAGWDKRTFAERLASSLKSALLGRTGRSRAERRMRRNGSKMTGSLLT